MPSDLRHLDGLVFKKTTNRLLDKVAEGDYAVEPFPTLDDLATEFGVSRATVHKAMQRLATLGVLRMGGRRKELVRRPRRADYFQVSEATPTKKEYAQEAVLAQISRGDLRPGARFSESEMSAQLGLSRPALREALYQISHIGVIEKPPRQKWRVVGLNRSIIDDAMEMRELLEAMGVRKLLQRPDSDPAFGALEALLEQHRAFAAMPRTPLADFMAADARLHETLLEAAENRYVRTWFAVCFFFIHATLEPRTEAQSSIRRVNAEHTRILEAILGRDETAAQRALAAHLGTVRQLLYESAALA